MVIQKETVQLAIGGDRDAFGTLYESVAAEMYRMALYTLGNAHDAEDAVAEAFTDAWRGIRALRDPERFRPWIFRILTAKCNRHIGSYVKERGNMDIDDYDAAAPDAVGGKGELAEALAALSPDERQMVLLSAVSGYTMREISEMLNVPPGTVSSKISRSMKKLRTLLES